MAPHPAAAPKISREARELLGTPSVELADLVELLQSSTGVALATLAVLDEGRFHFVVCAGSDTFVTEHEDAVCRFSMGHDGIFCISDLAVDERTSRMPFVDGRRGSLRFYASGPVYAPDGTMVGRLCLFDTEPRELDEQHAKLLGVLSSSVGTVLDVRLRQAREETSSPGRSSYDAVLAARIGHELRTPLAVIDGSLAVLADCVAGEGVARTMVDAAQRSARRLGDVLDGVMRLYRHQEPRLVPVDLGLTARRVTEDLAVELGRRDASVDIGDLPVVTADPDQMVVVLQNLVGNALRFARPGVAPRVQVSARRVPDAWRVEVTDNGIGVPAEDRHRVFALFTRLTDRGGYGIGLSTVAHVVMAHGGHLGVDDAPDPPGTTFWFELPDR